jgi:hypothetical protein
MFSLQALPRHTQLQVNANSNLIHFSKVKQLTEFHSIPLLRPFVSRLFAVTRLAKFNRFLICALSSSV